MSLRVVFAGTPQFAVPSLEALLSCDAGVVLVLTQPDRPAGRGRKLKHSPVKQLALTEDLELHQPVSLRTELDFLRGCAPDVMIVVAYGLLVPPEILALPPLGCINVHASLLPRWRGAAPIARAIEAGDNETGITLMQMDAGLDTGAILRQQGLGILDTDTAQTLHDKLGPLGGQLLADALPKIASHELKSFAQDDDKATYAAKITKSEGLIDWTTSAVSLERKIRAMNPWPVCYSFHDGNMIKIWQAVAAESDSNALPGTVLETPVKAISIQTGNGVLQATVLQRAGGKPLPGNEFVNGYPLVPGDRLQSA